MASDTEAAGEGAQTEEEDHPYYVEVWNDYDPSMRFAVIFPSIEQQGAQSSCAAYYIIEPGKHTGLHSDNVEEVMWVTEGEGEVFVIGATKKLNAGEFHVFPPGVDHDVYAHGSAALRVLSFFPAAEVEATFQQVVFPMGGNVVSSKPPESTVPTVTELDPNNLPEDFPFSLEELGMQEEEEPKTVSQTQRLLGFSEDGTPPEKMEIRVIDPRNPDVNLAETIEPRSDDDPVDVPEGGQG